MILTNKIHTRPFVIAVANRPLGQKDENRACPAASQRMMVRCTTELVMKYTRDILRETALPNFELQEYPQSSPLMAGIADIATLNIRESNSS